MTEQGEKEILVIKKWFLSFFAGALLWLIVGSAFAVPVTLDAWTQAQSVSDTTQFTPVSATDPAVVAGVAPFLGDRTLTAMLTSLDGTVDAKIGGGFFECNRSVTADGFCTVEYAVLGAFLLEEVEYIAYNDGAYGGVASVTFYKNGTQFYDQVVGISAVGVLYQKVLNKDFATGDIFSVRLNGDVAIDQALKPITGETKVPEPGSLALAGTALLALGGLTGRQRRQGRRAFFGALWRRLRA